MIDEREALGGQPPPVRNRSRDLRMVLSGVVAVLLIWFALGNLQKVPIHFWVASTKAPVIIVVVISGALGAAATMLVGRWRRHGAGSGRRTRGGAEPRQGSG